MPPIIEPQIEFRSFGEGTPIYQVLEKKSDSARIQIVESGEIVENYPLADLHSDPKIELNFERKKTLSDYEALNDKLSLSEIAKYVDEILSNSTDIGIEHTMECLEVLADRQWHGYEKNSDLCMNQLEAWLSKHKNKLTGELASSALNVSYSFGLSAGLFKELLINCPLEDRAEFEEGLNHTKKGKIDPWWSLSD